MLGTILDKLKHLWITFFLLSFIFYAFVSFSWANPTDSQKNFKQWIASERFISKKSADWEIQKAAIGDLIELLKEEEKIH